MDKSIVQGRLSIMGKLWNLPYVDCYEIKLVKCKSEKIKPAHPPKPPPRPKKKKKKSNEAKEEKK